MFQWSVHFVRSVNLTYNTKFHIFSQTTLDFLHYEEFLVGGKNVIFLELGLVYYAVAAGIGQLRFWYQVGGLVGFLVQIRHMGGISTIVFFYINWGFLCVSNWRSWESINGVWLGVSIGNLLILDTTRLNTCERTLMGILVAWLQTINGLFGWIRVLGVRAQ